MKKKHIVSLKDRLKELYYPEYNFIYTGNYYGKA